VQSQFRIAEKKLLDITREIEFARRREEVNEDGECAPSVPDMF
jgi:hypothetical protein